MLELKIAIYYRAESLPSQASYAVLAKESLGDFKLGKSDGLVHCSVKYAAVLWPSGNFLVRYFRNAF